MLGKNAFEIQKRSPGRFLVKQLLMMQPHRPGSAKVIQNVVCHVGESFEQNLVELMVLFKSVYTSECQSVWINAIVVCC